MKRLLLSCALILASAAASAQVADRDVLLTSDGTLYSVDVETPSASSWNTPATKFLTVTVQQGKTTSHTAVPESLNSGVNWRPALAYDGDSKTLFVFWLRRPVDSISSELNLASYHDGKWQPAVTIDRDASNIHSRSNLRIAITRHVAQLQKDGTTADVPALLVHAVWWEENSSGEEARYSLISIEKGAIASTETYSLRDLVQPGEAQGVEESFNRDMLRHPALVDGPTANSIDVIFGDTTTNAFNRTTLRPISDGRLHIPVGNRGGHPFPAPKALSADWSGHVSTLVGHDGRLVFANTSADAVSYVMFADGKWSSLQTLAVNEKFSADAALAAVAKMVNAE